MTFRLLAWAKNQKVGDPVAKSVLLLLAEAANSAGTCWPSHRTLCDDSEVPRRTLQRKLELLESLGLIRIETRARAKDGGQSSNLYRLLATANDVRPSGEEEEGASPCATVAHGAAPSGDVPPAPIVGAPYEPSSLTIETSEEVSPRRREIEADFARFWEVYPRKDEQRPALHQFDRLIRSRQVTGDELIAAAQRYAIAVHGREQAMIKLAENWLRLECWCEPSPRPTAPLADAQHGFSRTRFAGPPELRAMVAADRDEAWAAAWLDPCGWDPEARALIPRGPTARARITQEIGRLLRSQSVAVGEPKKVSS